MSAFSFRAGSAGNVTGGIIRIWNSICECLGKSDYILLTKYAGEAGGSLLVLLIACLLLTVVNFAILRCRRPWLLLLYVIIFFFVQILWNISPSAWSCVLFASVMIICWLHCFYGGRGSLWANILVLCISAVICAVGLAVMDDDYQHPESIKSLQQKVGGVIDSIRYGNNIRGDGSLEPSDFKNDSTVLEVKMEKPESLYLKGFSGALYADGKWTQLPNETYYEENDLFYWLHEKGFSGLNQLNQVSELMNKEDEENVITVTNVGASRKYIYYPYELMDPVIESGKSWSDSFVEAEGLTGAKEYSYRSSSNKTSRWPELSAEFFNTDGSDALDQYIINESHYNVSLYEDYTQLTFQQKKMLARYVGTKGNQEKEHVDYKQAISRIQAILEDNFIYSESDLKGDDPVEQFFKKKKGCDVHYASAATLMFRYYGIAARYVEGYIITPDDIKDIESGETIKVNAAANHAWTEIYIDGFGWVPLEITPEYYDKMKQPDMSKGLESDMVSDAFKNKRNIQQSKQVDNNPDAKKKNTDIPWMIIMILAAVIVLFILLVKLIVKKIKKYLDKKRRIKSFHNPDVKKGICAIYQYMLNEEMKIKEDIYRIGERLHLVRTRRQRKNEL